MLDVKKMGKQIAYVRMRNNCTQEQLAEVLGVSPQTVSKWGNGKAVPEAFILCGRSKPFHCSIDSILDPLAWSLCEIDFDYEFLVKPRVPIADYSGSEWDALDRPQRCAVAGTARDIWSLAVCVCPIR